MLMLREEEGQLAGEGGEAHVSLHLRLKRETLIGIQETGL
jgi:hypothetical protein